MMSISLLHGIRLSRFRGIERVRLGELDGLGGLGCWLAGCCGNSHPASGFWGETWWS